MKAKILIPFLTLLAMPAAAQVNYAVSGSTAYVTNSPNASGNIVIASTYNGYPVTSIGESAFFNCLSLTNVTIPDSVTDIGAGAFSNTGLRNLTIGNNVISLGSAAFSSCTSLTSATIGNSVTILIYTFYNCSSLTSVTIGNSVTNIGDLAFGNCRLTSVTIGNSVTSIGETAFGACTSLTNVVIPDSVTAMGDSAFVNCTRLTTVTIGNGVTRIGESAFFNCTSLRTVQIGKGVTSIGSYAFQYCFSLTNITFLGNAPSGGLNMFNNIAALARVYYYYGSTGWLPSYGGVPAVMLGAPAPEVGASSVGVKPGGFGFTVYGVVYQTIVIEASTNLLSWQPIGAKLLSAVSADFVDPQGTNYPHRFYRLRSN